MSRATLIGIAVTLMVTLLPGVRALADLGGPPPPETHDAAGSGQLDGTELVEEQDGIPCFRTTRTLFGLRGSGTFEGRSEAGDPVAYSAQIGPGQTLHGHGPLQVQLENTEVYYHSPYGTHGTETGGGAGCSPTTGGTPVPAEFRIFAAEGTQDTDGDADVDLLTGAAWVYRLNEAGEKVPCVGKGSFARATPDNVSAWRAEWTLSADCVVVGNGGSASATGAAPRGTFMTHHGSHGPCFDAPCTDNLKTDYQQYLPKPGPFVVVSGPASAAVGCNPQVTVTARLTLTGWPEQGVPVTFSVAGPGPAVPPEGTVNTDQDGNAAFSFTAVTPGDYTVTATATADGKQVSATHVVRFTDPPPPSVALATEPVRWQTEEDVTVTAAVNDACGPLPGAKVDFDVEWAPQDTPWTGQATPTSGSAVSDADGRASFIFSGDRTGDYRVTASTRIANEQASDTHTAHLEIRNFKRVGSVTLPEKDLNTAAMDPNGNYAYFATHDQEQVVKVDLATFERVGAITLTRPAPGAFTLRSAVIDPSGRFAYFAGDDVFKIDLARFEQVGTLTLQADERALVSAVIDPAGRYAYFGGGTPEGKIVKVDLATFNRVGAVDAKFGDQDLGQPESAIMDPAGRFAYFGTDGARVAKVDLATFQIADVVRLALGEDRPVSAVIDPAGDSAYFATFGLPGRVVKVDLRNFQRDGAITLGPSESIGFMSAAVIDPAGDFAYFSADQDLGYVDTATPLPAKVIKFDLRTFERVHAITLDSASDERAIVSGVIDPAGDYAYFGTNYPSSFLPQNVMAPDRVLKMQLKRPPSVALDAAADSYATENATPLAVPAPGVLANDADADGDPLVADHASDPAGGSVALNANGGFTYTPDAGFAGTDTFTYTASDGMDYSAPATVSVEVAPPQGLTATAYGYYSNVSLFGGPYGERGPAPTVTLTPDGANSPQDAHLDTAEAVYGPATLFKSGPIDVHAEGAMLPIPNATASSSVQGHPDPTQRPGPFLYDGVESTCSADASGPAASTTVTNGVVETKYDAQTQEPTQTQPVPAEPPPGYTVEGTIDHVGDSFRIVFNEQTENPDGSLVVNAAHMYLLGPIAVGDLIIGQSVCGGPHIDLPNFGAVADFDGDARSDVGVYRPRDGVWYLRQSTGGDTASAFGAPGDVATPADYDGDGKVDVAVYRPSTGVWYLRQSTGGETATAFGTDGDIPGPADFDGDAKADVAVYRPSTGVWYLRQSGAGDTAVAFGTDGDVPVVGDYDGDAKADIGVYRPSTGVWYLRQSSAGDTATAFGTDGDIPTVGDYDGDAKADVAVYRPSTGVWYLRQSSAGDTATVFGTDGDVPAPADYDGDGKIDLGVFRPSTGVWYLRQSTAGDTTTVFGTDGDVALPLPAAIHQRHFAQPGP